MTRQNALKGRRTRVSGARSAKEEVERGRTGSGMRLVVGASTTAQSLSRDV